MRERLVPVADDGEQWSRALATDNKLPDNTTQAEPTFAHGVHDVVLTMY